VLEHSRTNVPVNVPVNNRQEWFLKQVSAGRRVKASDLAAHGNISAGLGAGLGSVQGWGQASLIVVIVLWILKFYRF